MERSTKKEIKSVSCCCVCVCGVCVCVCVCALPRMRSKVGRLFEVG